MAKITLSSGVLRKGVRSTRAAAVLGQRASLFGVGRRGAQARGAQLKARIDRRGSNDRK